MKKSKATKSAALLMAFGLTAAACGSTADDLVDAGTDVVEDTADVVEDVVDGDEEAMDDEAMDDEAMEDESHDDDAMDDEAMEDEAMEDEAMEDDAAGDIPATVVDIATSSDDFSTLVAAVTEAGLVETLQGDGPFTVFAPTNDAFDALLAEGNLTAEELLGASDLADILTYHVIAGEVFAADAIAADGTAVETVNGASVEITVVDGQVVLDGIATVTTADLSAGNGVVHVIDAVLQP